MNRLNPYLKLGALFSCILISAAIAGTFGIIHDQLTYSISQEYFTKFKYLQFGINPSDFGGDRIAVAVIGFLATWWVGIIIGVCFGLTALIYPNSKTMLRAVLRAVALNFSTVIIVETGGFLYGRLHLIYTGVDWWLPDDLKDKNAFIIVGSMHNSAYLGGFVGLIAGVIYLLALKRTPQYQNN